jgi:hypothetical protein
MLSRDVAMALRRDGYDAVACQEELSANWPLSDEDQLQRANGEQRIVVTYNVADFINLARLWGAIGQSHAGLLLIHSKTIPAGDRRNQINALLNFLEPSKVMDTLEDQVLFLEKPR